MNKEQIAKEIADWGWRQTYMRWSKREQKVGESIALKALEHQEKRIAELEAQVAERDALLQGRIAVPKVELEKLEEARVALYKFLEDKLSEQQLLSLPNITGQIWRVANRKTWEDVK